MALLLWARRVMGYEEEGLSMGDEKKWQPWDMVKWVRDDYCDGDGDIYREGKRGVIRVSN